MHLHESSMVAFSASSVISVRSLSSGAYSPFHRHVCTCSSDVVPLQLPTLLPALLVGRPNRFIFQTVLPSLGSELVECHSPATGKIRGSGGILKFTASNPVRALVIPATSEKTRRTRYTVVALDIGAGGDSEAQWCGIHQTHSNYYLAHFLEQGAIPEVLPPGCTIRHEVTAPDGLSRIDMVGKTKDGREIWIENKTLLGSLPVSTSNPAFTEIPVRKKHSSTKAKLKARKTSTATENSSATTPNRMLKHWKSLSELAAKPDTDAVVVLTYLTNAPRFEPPSGPPASDEGPVEKHYRIVRAADDTRKAGVRFVQVNLQLTVNETTGAAQYSLVGVIDLDA